MAHDPEDVRAVAEALQARMGPVFGSPEYLADPIKLARAQRRQEEAARSQATTALSALLARGWTPPGSVEPDMFWDAEGEMGVSEPREILYTNYAPGEIVRLECAQRLPDRWAVGWEDENGGFHVQDFETAEEAEAAYNRVSNTGRGGE